MSSSAENALGRSFSMKLSAPPPKVDYTPTITLYKRLLTEFPN